MTVIGGSQPYRYFWNRNAGIQQDLNNISAGVYSLTVTDRNNCTDTLTAQVTEPTPLAVTGTTINPPCHGGNSGSIDITVTGGLAPYTYLWNNASPINVEDPTGLTAGTYTVTVTDANGCTVVYTTTLTEPTPMAATITSQDISCNGFTDGYLIANVSGGVQPYTYRWSNGLGFNPTLSAVGAGTYCVTITDANGCNLFRCDTLSQPAALNLTLAVADNVSCPNGSDGAINSTVTGGLPPYQYVWDDNSNAPNPTGLSARTHAVTITDANGCIQSDSIPITEPQPISLSANAVASITCFGHTDAEALATASGGTAPYSYAWSNGDSGPRADSLGDGTYTVIMTDANGCSANTNITFVEPTRLQLSISGIDARCYGGNDGTATVQVSGATPGYTYLWDTYQVQTASTATGLAAGTYTVTVTDNNGCKDSISYLIDEPNTPLSISTVQTPAPCYDTPTGTATAFAGGGVGSYSYQWNTNPVQATPTADSLRAGTYIVAAIDGNGCIITDTIAVTQASPILPNATGIDISCFGECDGTITTAPTGGTGSHFVAYSNGTSGASTQGLCAGSYYITVTDQLGCVVTDSVVIIEPQAIGASEQFVIPSCQGLLDGVAEAYPQGGTAPHTITWSNGAQGAVNSGLGDGTYRYTIVDARGCSYIDSITLHEFSPFAYGNETTCADIADGIIVTGATGGYPPYETTVDGAYFGNDSIITGWLPGTYTVTMRDNNGCEVDLPITITAPPSITFGNFDDPVIALGDSVLLDIPTNSNYFFPQWLSGNVNEAVPSIACDTCRRTFVAPLVTTTYTFLVETVEGCFSETQITVTVEADHKIYFPRAFSPAPVSVGENDYLFPQSDGMEVANIDEFRVYDRWGNLVFETRDIQPDVPSMGWDGYKNAKLLPADAYIWQVRATFIDGHTGVFEGQTFLSK